MKLWEKEEAEVFTKIIFLSDDLVIITFLYYLYRIISENGLFQGKTALSLILIVTYRVSFGYLRGIRRALTQFWIMFVLAQLGQCLIAVTVVNVPSESFSLHQICSTVVLMLSEISPIHSQLVNCLLITKHLCLWTWVAQCRGVPGEALSFLPAIWCFWCLLHMQAHKRRLLVEKQQADEKKDVEEKRLEALLSALPDGVIVLSETMQVLTWNPAARRKLGLETTEKPEEKAPSVVANLAYDVEYMDKGEESRQFGSDLQALLQQKEGALENFRPVLLEGRHLECRGCVNKWDDCKVLILTIRNISTWIQMEKAAKRDSANKTALIRSVSHELRTPVNAIINLCQDLQVSHTIGEHDREEVEVLANASNFLLSMINDLLDYSRILHDKFSLTKTTFDLEHLIRSCGQLIALQCKQKNVDFIMRFDPFLPKIAYTDENRLKQVILNLLSNAAKFTVKGSVTLIAMLSRSGQLQVSVEDTGIGIPPDKLQSIFTMFGKLDNIELNQQGCGLGLSISSMILAKLDGETLQVASVPQCGSIFSFKIPIGGDLIYTPTSQSMDEELMEIPEENALIIRSSFNASSYSTAQILIVDDAPFNRLVLRKILEAAGYSFAEASTGLEAVNTIRAAYVRGSPFSVVLMDVEMPEMDGITATRELLRLVGSGELGSVPVIVGCSAFSSEDDRAAALAAGMSHYLEKPVSRTRLLELVDLLCSD